MGAKLLNTQEKQHWGGITIVVAGEAVGHIETLTLVNRVKLDHIAEIMSGLLERVSMGCAVMEAKCAICGKEWDDEDSEHGR